MYGTSSASGSDTSSKEAAKALAQKRLAIALAPDIGMELTLDMQIRDLKKIPSDFFQSKHQALRRAIILDVAQAIDARPDHIVIHHIKAATDTILLSITLETGVCGDKQSSIEAAKSLQEQAADPKSKLIMHGKYTSKTKSIALFSGSFNSQSDSGTAQRKAILLMCMIPTT
jgi:hypothetical protein